MISYIKVDNSIQAYFGDLTDNDDTFLHWYHELSQYFTKHSKNVSAYLVSSIVNDVLCECKASGMKFYGEAKCSPEDTFNEKIGKGLTKKRLLAKYNRVLSMIDEELLKVLQNDIDFINRHKERGQHR